MKIIFQPHLILTFTALQKMGVDPRLLYSPDDGHWDLKPQDSALWYNTVITWFDQHLKPNDKKFCCRPRFIQPAVR
jgi:dipeptidyl aminopeptidase/acylaminoacyl peptidase